MHQEIARWLIWAGMLLIVAGVIYYFFNDKLHWIGRLPGDIRIEREHFRFYFPITTMLLFSLVVHVLLRLIRYFS